MSIFGRFTDWVLGDSRERLPGMFSKPAPVEREPNPTPAPPKKYLTLPDGERVIDCGDLREALKTLRRARDVTM